MLRSGVDEIAENYNQSLGLSMNNDFLFTY